eukprot:scaffold223150_cov24-Tisochrysis_lutea.AAC.1
MQIKFNLGIMLNDAIADDRAFNTASLTNATAGWATFNAPYGCVVCVLCGGLKWDGGISRSFDPINAPVREPGGSAPDEFPQVLF